MADYNKLSLKERREVDRKVTLGYGSLVPINYRTIVEEEVLVEVAKGAKGSKGEKGTPEQVETKDTVVDVEELHYVGKLTAGQTGGVISILAAIFANGADLKKLSGRGDNVAFLEFLDEYHLTLLFGIILDAEQTWVSQVWDLGWAVDVIAAFWEHNDFFVLGEKIMKVAQRSGITEGSALRIVQGGRSD